MLLSLPGGNIWTMNNESPRLDEKKGGQLFLVITKQAEVAHVSLPSSLGREGTPESDQRKTSDGRTNLTTEGKPGKRFLHEKTEVASSQQGSKQRPSRMGHLPPKA